MDREHQLSRSLPAQSQRRCRESGGCPTEDKSGQVQSLPIHTLTKVLDAQSPATVRIGSIQLGDARTRVTRGVFPQMVMVCLAAPRPRRDLRSTLPAGVGRIPSWCSRWWRDQPARLQPGCPTAWQSRSDKTSSHVGRRMERSWWWRNTTTSEAPIIPTKQRSPRPPLVLYLLYSVPPHESPTTSTWICTSGPRLVLP